MDVIALRGIRAYGRHGARTGERENAQPFDLEAIVEIDLRRAERSDELSDTLDYAQLHARLVQVVQTTSFALLERLAAELIGTIFCDSRVASAQIEIGKPGLLDGATPSVRLRRENERFRTESEPGG